MNRRGKFAVGDRVVYKYCGFGGNWLLNGKHGVVRAVNNYRSHVDYDVEFYDWFPDSMDLKVSHIPEGHGWACTEEHLEKA